MGRKCLVYAETDKGTLLGQAGLLVLYRLAPSLPRIFHGHVAMKK
jgi:hypothetical protein